MKPVDIIFKNIQSHQLTHFSLEPGVNFILADDNNVGKSTIFNVLTTIASAPKNKPDTLKHFVRTGCTEAFAQFKFESQSVVACFTAYPGESAKLFFQYIDENGDTTRHSSCPPALLDALGISVGSDGVVLNFNNADSVQLISKTSTEADAVITNVMLDPTVETIKQNMVQLYRDINIDINSMEKEVTLMKSMLEGMTYVNEVDTYFEELPSLSVLCRLCDVNFGVVSGSNRETPSADQLKVLLGLLDTAQVLQSVTQWRDIEAPKGADLLLRFAEGFVGSDFSVMSRSINTNDLNTINTLTRVTGGILSAMLAAERVVSLGRSNDKATEEIEAVKKAMASVSQIVECPMKGKVFYTNEECVPFGD